MSHVRYKDQYSFSTGLLVHLIKQSYVFPWSQFIFAECEADKICMAFSTHNVTITGGKLDKLMEGITAQSVNMIKEPIRAESFKQSFEPEIVSITVEIVVTKADKSD